MTKPLPYIAIEGVGKTKEEVLDSLIAIEPLLVRWGGIQGQKSGTTTVWYQRLIINLH